MESKVLSLFILSYITETEFADEALLGIPDGNIMVKIPDDADYAALADEQLRAAARTDDEVAKRIFLNTAAVYAYLSEIKRRFPA